MAVGRALRMADLVTYDADALRLASRRLGAGDDKLLSVVLGVDREFIALLDRFNVPVAKRPPVVISQRSLEHPNFNIDIIIRAMAIVHQRAPEARLLIGNEGRLRPALEALARGLSLQETVRFTGLAADQTELAERLGRAAVYVSIPDTDGTSVGLLESMAAGAYPVLSDLPANREWVDDDAGELVPTPDPNALAAALSRALEQTDRRVQAAAINQATVQDRGLWENNMAVMEAAYRRLIAK
jgi:glycosyltransferase involved in cell wall biosynthesis